MAKKPLFYILQMLIQLSPRHS